MLRQLEASGSTRFCIGLGCSTEKRLPLAFADGLKMQLQRCQLIATLIHRDLPPVS